MQVVDSYIKKNGLHSRNEFFEKAAENLIADEAIKSGGDVMSEKLAKAIEAVSENNAGGGFVHQKERASLTE